MNWGAAADSIVSNLCRLFVVDGCALVDWSSRRVAETPGPGVGTAVHPGVEAPSSSAIKSDSRRRSRICRTSSTSER